jgi:hypothetical protein
MKFNNPEHKRAFLATGWFSDAWKRQADELVACLDEIGLNYFCAYKESIVDGAVASNEAKRKAYYTDIENAAASDFFIVNTSGSERPSHDGRMDIGCAVEIGEAIVLRKPIIYVWLNRPEGMTPNLMLGRSGICWCFSIQELKDTLNKLIENNFDYESIRKEWDGEEE